MISKEFIAFIDTYDEIERVLLPIIKGEFEISN